MLVLSIDRDSHGLSTLMLRMDLHFLHLLVLVSVRSPLPFALSVNCPAGSGTACYTGTANFHTIIIHHLSSTMGIPLVASASHNDLRAYPFKMGRHTVTFSPKRCVYPRSIMIWEPSCSEHHESGNPCPFTRYPPTNQLNTMGFP